MEANVPGVKLPLAFEIIPAGHSNITYRVRDAAGNIFVLRRPPLGAVLATAHDMTREHRIIAALGSTSIPVPEALGLCEDIEVNDAPFYVMNFVDGHVLTTAAQSERHFDVLARQTLSASTVESLAALHDIDPDAVGLATLGKKEDYIPRQIRRWRGQWEKSKTRELQTMETVADALEQQVPEQRGAAIVHGDYRLGNCITGIDAKIAAILDWELCTLGDPLADVGYLLNDWAAPGERSLGTAESSPSAAEGFWDRKQLLASYEERTGRSLDRVAYYRAFQYWRLAAIVEGVLARYLKGVMGKSGDTDAFRRTVDGFAEAALQMIRRDS
jgi:aminoglycoside phosphotransferase (APT) family kinase protein